MNEQGFTLVEMIIVITIIGTIVASLTGLFTEGGASFSRVNQQTELQQNLRMAMDLIVDEIRESRGIIALNENEITFEALSDQGTITKRFYLGDEEDEAHHLPGSALYLKIDDGEPEQLALYIEELFFEGKPANSPAGNIEMVQVTITGKLTNGKEIKLSSGAEIRWLSLQKITK